MTFAQNPGKPGVFDNFLETCTGQNTPHTLTDLLRQSIYSRLAGIENKN
jgi:hypothetical protein